MNHPNRNISGERRAIYYLGLALLVIGFLVFGSVFVTAATSFGDFTNFEGRSSSMAVRAIAGMGMVLVGGVLMNIGSRGLAGSGVILDPQRTRQDLEPWTRSAGGMLRDALDETEVRIGGNDKKTEMSFDEKLRRLEQLRNEGLISESEYQTKRREVLDQQW